MSAAPAAAPAPAAGPSRPEATTAWRDALSRDEIASLVELSDLRGFLALAVDWGLVAAFFVLVAVWPNPLTVLVALFGIGARQLGFAVLMHEAAHRTLFRTRWLNDFVGDWLVSYPILSNVADYRPYHLRHHAKTGTEEDPDLHLTAPFPITRSSFRRKVWRDLSGTTGLKFLRFRVRKEVGTGPWRERLRNGLRSRVLRGAVLSNAVLLGVLWALGHPWLYLLWVGAWLTTNTLVTRIRAIAEHSMVPDPPHPTRGTRTTLPSWWERLFVAPNRVNYHLEHHLLMTVPMHNLPRMHALLRERGVLEDAVVSHGYLDVLRLAVSKPEARAA